MPSTTAAALPLPDRIAAAMPASVAAAAALVELDNTIRTQDATLYADDPMALREHAAAELLAGRPVPADLGDRIAAHATALLVEDARVDTLQQIRGLILVAGRDAGMDEADAGLSVVRDELAEVLDAGRPIIRGPLVKVFDPADVVNADSAEVIAAWRAALLLASRYAALRRAQRELTRGALAAGDVSMGGGGGRPLARLVTPEHRRDVDRVTREVGWFRTSIGDGRPTGDAMADLRAACLPGATPWVPSVRQLIAACPELVAQ